MTTTPTLEPVQRLTRDIKAASATLGRDEARFLVDAYYTAQEDRKRTANQSRALDKSEEPHATIDFFLSQFNTTEKEIAKALDAYSAADPLGQWARSIVGIGPVIAAGLLAHIDVERANTAGAIWRFAGLDPTAEWKKGQKRPYNAKLKVLCWKIGDSFVKVSGNDEALYGKIYRQRKEYEVARDNEVMDVTSLVQGDDLLQGDGSVLVKIDGEAHSAFSIEQKDGSIKWFAKGNAKWASQTLRTKNIKDEATLAIYRTGRLPAGRLDYRARRYAVKLFLAHYHEVGRKLKGLDVPAPYPLAHLGHNDRIAPPNFEW